MNHPVAGCLKWSVGVVDCGLTFAAQISPAFWPSLSG
jgi:hypothetical protein